MESVGVEFVGRDNVALFAGNDAEVAFLADSPVDINFTFQSITKTPIIDYPLYSGLFTYLRNNVKIKNQIFVI